MILADLALALGLLIAVLVVIHQLADRRLRVRGDLDEIEIGFVRELAGVIRANDADLLTTGSDESDFGNSDSLVDASFSADVAS